MRIFKALYVSFFIIVFISSLLISCNSKKKKEYNSSLKEIKIMYQNYYDGKPLSNVNLSDKGQYKPLVELENKFVIKSQGTDTLIKNRIEKLHKFDFTNFTKSSLKKYKDNIDALKNSYTKDLEKLETTQKELQTEIDKMPIPEYGKDYSKIAHDRTSLQLDYTKKRKALIEAYIKNLEQIYSFMNSFLGNTKKKDFDINAEISKLDKLNKESDQIVKDSEKLESELKNKILKLLS